MALKAPDHVMNVTMDLGRNEFTMEDAFDLRVDAVEVGNASEELWTELTDDHKNVLTQITKRSLEVLHENIDAWLPNVLTGGPGDMVTVRTQILLSQIEEQVEIIQAASSFEKNAAKQEMLAEVLGKRKPLTTEQFIASVSESLENGIHIPSHAVERLVNIINGTDTVVVDDDEDEDEDDEDE